MLRENCFYFETQVNGIIASEKELCKNILLPATADKTLSKCYTSMIIRRSASLKTEFSALLESCKYEGGH